MVCRYCEEEAVKAKQFSIPDRLSSEEKRIFFIVVIGIQCMLFVAFFFIYDKYTNYEVVSAGVCENAVSLQCPRGNFECASMFPPQSPLLMAGLWEEKSYYHQHINASDAGRVFWRWHRHTVRVFGVKDTVCNSLGF